MKELFDKATAGYEPPLPGTVDVVAWATGLLSLAILLVWLVGFTLFTVSMKRLAVYIDRGDLTERASNALTAAAVVLLLGIATIVSTLGWGWDPGDIVPILLVIGIFIGLVTAFVMHANLVYALWEGLKP